MKKQRTDVIVGIFSLCAIIVLIGGILFLKEFRFNQDSYDVTVLFDNASGLKEGDPVMVAGVRKGLVKSIALRQGGVRIVLSLQRDVQLNDDATFSITSSGLVGLKYVEVEAGQSGRPLDVSAPLQGQHQFDAFEVVGMMGDLISEMRQLVDKIDHCLTEEGVLGSMRQTLVDAKETMRTIRTLVDENRGDFSQAIQNVQAASEGMRGLVENNRTAIDSTVRQFQASAERFDTTLLQLEEMSSTLKSISDRIERGDGTLGQLVTDKQLYNDLQQTTREINLLIEDIKKNPGKYLKISVFDF